MSRLVFVLALMLDGAPVAAQNPDETPGSDRQRIEDVARAPLDVLNIDKADVPDKLFLVQFAPYDLTGITDCGAIAGEVGALDRLLGRDVDMDLRGDYDAGDMAFDVGEATAASLIPFSGIVRQLSGAAAKDRRIRYALWHGAARRSFLKGVGTAWGCAWPAARVPQLGYDLRGF